MERVAVLGLGRMREPIAENLVPQEFEVGTCFPSDTRRIATCVVSADGRFIDAPVTGGVDGPRDESLMLMAGGIEAILESLRPLIYALYKEIYHFEPIGSGHAAKLIESMIGWIEVAGIAEGLALAKPVNLDKGRFFQMLSSSHSNSPIVQSMVPKVLSGAFDDVEFRLDLAYKDIRQAAELGSQSAKLPLPVVNVATELFQLAGAFGFGAQDSIAAVRGLERVLEQEIRDARFANFHPKLEARLQ